MKYFAELSILLTLCYSTIYSQSERLIEQIAPFAYEVTIKNGRLSGPGAELLLYEITQADFFLIGEEKGVAEIPGLTQVIYQRAYDMGLRFTHVGIETSDFTARTLENLAIDADAEYLLQEYFDSHKGEIPYYEGKEETQMLSDILATAEDYYHVIWGLSHISITSTPSVFASLARNTQDKKAVKLATKLQRQMEKDNETAISQKDSSKFGLLQLTDSDFEELVIEFDSTEEVLKIVEAVKTSKDLYEKRYNDESSAYKASRTSWMYKQFLSFYQEAEAVEAKLPRIIVKMEADQIYRGNIPGTNIASLGERIALFAQNNDRTTFHLRIMAGPDSDIMKYNPVTGYDTLSATVSSDSAYLDFAALASDGWRVFDLRSIRKNVDLNKLSKQTAKLIEEYDALIILQGSSPATIR